MEKNAVRTREQEVEHRLGRAALKRCSGVSTGTKGRDNKSKDRK